MDMSYFVWHLGCFHFWAIVNYVAINTHVQVSVWAPVSNSGGGASGEELLGHMVILCLNFWRVAPLLCTAATRFYILLLLLQPSRYRDGEDVSSNLLPPWAGSGIETQAPSVLWIPQIHPSLAFSTQKLSKGQEGPSTHHGGTRAFAH